MAVAVHGGITPGVTPVLPSHNFPAAISEWEMHTKKKWCKWCRIRRIPAQGCSGQPGLAAPRGTEPSVPAPTSSSQPTEKPSKADVCTEVELLVQNKSSSSSFQGPQLRAALASAEECNGLGFCIKNILKQSAINSPGEISQQKTGAKGVGGWGLVCFSPLGKSHCRKTGATAGRGWEMGWGSRLLLPALRGQSSAG